MKAGIFYFTTSGNTENMADTLASAWEAKGVEVVKKPFSEADAGDLDGLDIVALGSPAQGTEEVDDTEFKPFYDDNLTALKGKKLFLFGSFGWGGGEYMETFADTAKADGIKVVGVYTHLEALDDEAGEELKEKAASVL
ncbi:putative flavodoxin [Mageeibacillus indolicus UPII9-5]|uniref:Flavodoxin-like domain-containing protein n=2 Tax=Mageeibacillus indolicus TaxID=884684 RepID=A0A2J8B4S1_9FIRM|nr:flavodoxin domain-containing protein [Mageeibacillus indolicus]ADC91296.1 putative flavodoxin [Mageeibacillus indolicus UPII9-5]PNH19771.1 hypothetical protein B7R76_02525 [Mageeibacillus indolicus]